MLKTVGNPSTRYGNQTIINGNEVIGTPGQGIDFSANAHAAGMTSELLNWYEEGVFTPTVVGSTSAGTAAYTRNTGRYTRVGRLVTFSIDLAWNAGTGTGNLIFAGLPFTSASINTGIGSSFCTFPTTAGNIHSPWMQGPTSQISSFQSPVGGGGVTAVPYSGNGDVMLFGSYIV